MTLFSRILPRTPTISWVLRTALTVLPILAAVALLFSGGSLKALDGYWLDYLVRTCSPMRGIDPHIVLVGISERSLESLGVKRPIPRAIYARLLEKLTGKLGAAAVAVDMFFTPSIYPEGDREVMELARRSKRIVFIVKPLGQEESPGGERILEPLDGAMNHSAFHLAHPNFILERGIVRRVEAAKAFQGWEYPALALGALACGEKQAVQILPRDPAGHERPWYMPGGRALRVGSRVRHLAGNELFINYYRAVSGALFTTYRFEDIVRGTLPDGMLEDKIVFLGALDTFEHDYHSTPLGIRPGMEVHGVILKNLLGDELITPVKPVLILILTVAVVLLFALVHRKARSVTTFALFLFLLTTFFGAGILLYTQRIFMEISPLFLSLSTSYVFLTLFRTREIEREKAYIRDVFSRYAPRQVVNEILDNYEKINLKGERREVTILFSDIDSFTAIAEMQPPEVTIRLLNEYFERMTQVIFKYDGLIRGYIGDEIMVIFGAPVAREDHARRALLTAWEMRQEAMQLKQERLERGMPGFDVKFGINSGHVVLGNIGSTNRLQYDAVGDMANTASRIMGLNKREDLSLSTHILVGERTMELAGDEFVFRELGLQAIRGKVSGVTIFELTGSPTSACAP